VKTRFQAVAFKWVNLCRYAVSAIDSCFREDSGRFKCGKIQQIQELGGAVQV
jgi:hypothetical protein